MERGIGLEIVTVTMQNEVRASMNTLGMWPSGMNYSERAPGKRTRGETESERRDIAEDRVSLWHASLEARSTRQQKIQPMDKNMSGWTECLTCRNTNSG